MMARRSGTSHKCVEEKRRQLPIYQHYTLNPGRTKSHHPEARCIHCQKEFVCGSKQRLIRHIRKCNSITNPEQIIAETLNTLARNSATGQLNHSILEASNLLPSQISHIQHSANQQLVGQAINQNSTTISPTVTTATNSTIQSNSNSNNSNNNGSKTSGSLLSAGDQLAIASSSNNSSPSYTKKPAKRGRKPGSRNSVGPGIHVTTGLDGKTHFLPASQLTQMVAHGSPQIIGQTHGGQVSYAYQATVGSNTTSPVNITAAGAHINASNSGHLSCATLTHHSSPYKLNSELIDKAYLKLVLTRNLPLSLCDTKEFQAWLKTFANDYKPPNSINLIAQNLKIEAQSAKCRVTNILNKAPKKTINLELHHWPDDIRGHSWYALIAGHDQRRFLISVKDLTGQMRTSAKPEDGPNKLLMEFIDDNVKRVSSDRVNNLILTGKRDAYHIFEHARESLYTTHPSIVTYYCWWYFTNLLCSDIFELNESFRTLLRNSNLLIDFFNKRPELSSTLEKFGPFSGASGALYQKRDSSRWYSHLTCYLLQYLKNNCESITRALEESSMSGVIFYNNDNNNNTSTAGTAQTGVQQIHTTGTQHNSQNSVHRHSQFEEIKSIVMSTDYWESLNSALVYLKSFQDIVALAPAPTANNMQNNIMHATDQKTPVISPTICNNLSLSEYMEWFLRYGKTLINNWGQLPDANTYQLIDRYATRFLSAIKEFKLLFAAYLLNPKHRCAYMTQRSKDSAIEEILDIASEFMPEESDGHTIFDQWKLYLVREEPYDMTFDESKSSPLDWWMSLPCAESIRRVALRILRLRAFSSPKPENLFAPLYFYEDETNSKLNRSSFEELATVRYFYDHEDKLNQVGPQSSLYTCNHNSGNSISSPVSANGFTDRTHAGIVHAFQATDMDDPGKFLPIDQLEPTVTNGQLDNLSKYREVSIVDSMDDNGDAVSNSVSNTFDGNLDNLHSYKSFCAYVDFNDLGIQEPVAEEPVEKKKRKWTAQEILSKCQSNNHNNYNNKHEIQQK